MAAIGTLNYIIIFLHCILFVKNAVREHFTTQFKLLTTLRKKPFENIEGKGENAGDQHFLLFPHRYLLCPKQISIFEPHLLFSLQLQFCCLVKS